MKKLPASEAARWQSPSRLWLDHAVVAEDDREWMAGAELVLLWNVELPDGFLASLPKLRGVSLRGGSADDLAAVRDCRRLLMLDVNQVRGLSDLSDLAQIESLEFLSLYGLPRVATLPRLDRLRSLASCQLGSMKGLHDIDGLLAAPCLRRLLFIRRVTVTASDADAIATHPAIEEFTWFDEDVPGRLTEPVVSRLAHLARPPLISPEEWLEHRLS